MFETSITELCRQLRRNQTQVELQLWTALCDRQFKGYKFRRQHPFIYECLQGKKRFFIVDFYCARKNLVIELDGKKHEYQQDYDKNRDWVLSQLGLRTIRFKNEELLFDFNRVRNTVFQILLE